MIYTYFCNINFCGTVFNHARSMESNIRGFSFMAQNKIEIEDLQFIEGDELERAWKHTRRERLKQREQKIWDEFVNENDIVHSVCEDDQYQFLEQLSEPCLKELMESELQKMRNEMKAEEMKTQELAVNQQGEGDVFNGESPHNCVVQFAEEVVKDACDMFHIFDDEKDELSGADDALNDSLNSPPTAREKQADQERKSGENSVSLERPNSAVTSSKSSENGSIESSIYCAKVKDLRIKISDDLIEMISALDRHDIFAMEQEDIARMIKRSAEFCARFNRIYMYQLQRQMHDIKRNNSLTLPFAKHTQFQSQMVRVVSLHQNLLQAVQVFRKSTEQAWCVREGVSALKGLIETARSITSLCISIKQPKDLFAAQSLYYDNLIPACEKLEQFVDEYTVRCEEFLKEFANMTVSQRKKSPKKSKKRSIMQNSQNSKTVTDTASKLSMYSLDTLRLNSKSPKEIAQKRQANIVTNSINLKLDPNDKIEPPPKSHRKTSGRSRRPLMRDPHAGKPRQMAKPVRDHDIQTMVQSVKECTSSHVSLACSNVNSITPFTPRNSHTPRTARKDPQSSRKHQYDTPRKTKIQTPKLPAQAQVQPQAQNPKPVHIKPTLSCLQNVTQELKPGQLSPLCKMYYPNSKAIQEVESGHKEEAYKPNEEYNRSEEYGAPKEEMSMSESTKLDTDHDQPKMSLKSPKDGRKSKEKIKSVKSPDQCEVTKLLKQLCSGDSPGCRIERTSGAKNAQLLCISGNSPRAQPSTPQLLRILEETIQKKVPKSFYKILGARDVEKYRMTFNIADQVANNLFQYRTKFVQHMLTSPMYANSAVGKPWEMISNVSEHIIDEVLLSCAKEMELREVLQDLYRRETTIS